MQTVASFGSGEDAHLFRSFLEAQGIRAHVFDEYVPQLFWHYTQAIGGVRVTVEDEDWEMAKSLHGEYMEALRDGPPATGVVKAWPVVLLISISFGLPLMLFGRKSLSRRDGNP